MEKKYLISDTEENDSLALDLMEIQEFLATERAIKNDINKKTYLMGVSSPLLNIPLLGLYDQEDLLKKYPNGVVTENFILMPLEQFKTLKLSSMIEDDKNDYKSYGIGNFAIYLHQYMLNYLEVALNIEINQDDKFKLISDVTDVTAKELKFVFKKEMIQTYKGKEFIKVVEEPEKTTNRELLKLIEGKGYFIEERLKNTLNVEQDVKEILKLNESYITGITVLENKIQEVSFKEINENINIEEFKELINSANTGKITQVTPLKIVKKKIDKLIKESDSDIQDFISKAQNEIFPFMASLNTLQFKLSMEYIMKEVFEPHNSKFESNYKDYLNIKKDFAVALYKQTDSSQSEYLISVISGFDVLNKHHLNLTSNKKKFN